MLVTQNNFLSFLHKIASTGYDGIRKIIVINEEGQLELLSETSRVEIGGFRAIDPVKVLYYHPREQLFPLRNDEEPFMVVGLKACDLQAIRLLDRALIMGDYTDPQYMRWRQNAFIISSDCTAITATCHCNLKNGKPYNEEGFDVNLTVLADNVYLQAGSEKGEGFLQKLKEEIPYEDENSTIQLRIKEQRESIMGKLREQNGIYQLNPQAQILKRHDDPRWKEQSEKCVGCAACTNICPTCICLILTDEGAGNRFVKVRSYDSCQLHGYARVAGGATPRPAMFQRFANRYLCKQVYMPDEFELSGCTGCGRCIEACPARIDMRQVLAGVSAKQSETVSL